MTRELSLISFFLIAGCTPQLHISQSKEIANVDSLMAAISLSADFMERNFRYFFVDSLEKHMPMSGQDSVEIRGKNRMFRENWLNNKVIERGGRGSRLEVIQDSSFNVVTHVVYSSQLDLSLVVEEYIFQPFNFKLTRLFGTEGTKQTGFKFDNLGAFESFFNTFKIGKYRWHKKSGTTYYVSSLTGSDLDNGLSWANAWATLAKLNGNIAASDSVICNGTFNETHSPTYDGTSGDPIVIMDSLSFTLGFNKTNPDTSKLWSAKINGQGTRLYTWEFGNDHYIKLIGFDHLGATAYNLIWASGNQHMGDVVLQNRFRGHGDGIGALVYIAGVSTSSVDSLISCVFLGDNAIQRGIYFSGDIPFVFINNTISGNFNEDSIFFNGSNDGVVYKNNLLECTSATARLMYMNDAMPQTLITDWNYNQYHAPGNTTTEWYFRILFDRYSVWVDSVNNYDADGEAFSDSVDFDLKNALVTAYITTGSSAFNAGSGNIYNDTTNPSIGYYQPVSAPPAAVGRRRVIIIQ